jgi:hypothetical protein
MPLPLLLAALLTQAPAPDPCQAIGPTPPPASARCPAWRSILNHGGGEMFVDPASVHRSGDGFEIRIRVVFPSDRPDGGRSGMSQLRFECGSRTSAVLRLTSFTAAGGLLSDEPATGSAARPVLLLTAGPFVDLLNEFCPATNVAQRRAALQRATGEWRSASRDSEGELSFDTVPAERNGDTVTVRTLMVFNAVNSDGVRSYITLLRINCAGRTASMRHMTVFRDDGIPMIDDDLTGDGAAERPVAGAAGRTMFGQFCAGRG